MFIQNPHQKKIQNLTPKSPENVQKPCFSSKNLTIEQFTYHNTFGRIVQNALRIVITPSNPGPSGFIRIWPAPEKRVTHLVIIARVWGYGRGLSLLILIVALGGIVHLVIPNGMGVCHPFHYPEVI